MTTKQRFEKHRREAVITCDEDCLCWDVEIMAAQIAALKVELDDGQRWLREVLTDYKIPFDDHEPGRRLALTCFLYRLAAERDRLKAVLTDQLADAGKEIERLKAEIPSPASPFRTSDRSRAG